MEAIASDPFGDRRQLGNNRGMQRIQRRKSEGGFRQIARLSHVKKWLGNGVSGGNSIINHGVYFSRRKSKN